MSKISQIFANRRTNKNFSRTCWLEINLTKNRSPNF